MKTKDYERIRNLIEDGDIVFITTKSVIGSIIRFITRSRFSHVGIVFWLSPTTKDRIMIVEAQGTPGRRIVNLSFYDNAKEMVVITAPKPWHYVSRIALRKLGKVPYGWGDAIYIGFREFLLKYLDIQIGRADFPGETCGEFVANVYSLPKTTVSPQLLYEQLTKLGHKIKIGVTK